MVKVIKIRDENYKRLLTIVHELETVNNKRTSFDSAISLLIDKYEAIHEQKANKRGRTKG